MRITIKTVVRIYNNTTMRIELRKLYGYAPYLNTEAGFDTSLPDTATEEEMIAELDRLNDITDRWHRKRYPEMYINPNEEFDKMAKEGAIAVQQVEPTNPEDEVTAISNAATLTELATFKAISSRTPAHRAAYNQRLGELAHQ